MRACVLYHLHGTIFAQPFPCSDILLDFDSAERQFDRILAIDPHRVDDIDVYSNILYVTENRLKLSRLAHDFLATDKDRPEVCALVGSSPVRVTLLLLFNTAAGNHYSLRAEHERAIKYFRRATQLDGTYLAAWTLMGHEYVEMKNSQSAIESYRRAIGSYLAWSRSPISPNCADVNRKDYRAWYGLGQAYELLNMHFYSLHYYEHATALRCVKSSVFLDHVMMDHTGRTMSDSGKRRGCALRKWEGKDLSRDTYAVLIGSRYREAVECLKRALIPADPHEITINLKLAKIYNTMREYSESTAYHRRVVEVCQADRKL